MKVLWPSGSASAIHPPDPCSRPTEHSNTGPAGEQRAHYHQATGPSFCVKCIDMNFQLRIPTLEACSHLHQNQVVMYAGYSVFFCFEFCTLYCEFFCLDSSVRFGTYLLVHTHRFFSQSRYIGSVFIGCFFIVRYPTLLKTSPLHNNDIIYPT